ncbi:MAG TPA: HPr family phosphocarrier protein [Spirochaetota bacterium]|jgi:phosphotransferase system HPr (HPr) family protein|nr:HPr family phosphocarrier protein [Spirochaetota bacterium]HOH36480.1 HPr family phosphocarrier protein [Spirochaetota bacterium]HPJ14011.1 HPr family phosphocarrier protein [Spirochaetota bacterium]HPM33365.1 HPr family phosphocarrier protein [Spirochaetota bacterium]HPY01788.1 HPr family phosphocarrier protein [Spirochaetota bacterium]
MFEKEIVVTHDAGLHARPATMIVKIAMQYDSCEVYLIKDKDEANAKSIMSVLGLGISNGTKLVVRAEGAKESEVVERICKLIETDFDKDKNAL